jgi:transcriptional regulator of acetoin/glycerol metabolism
MPRTPAPDGGHRRPGVLLWVEGAHALRSNAEAMNFVEGARWSEDCAGTNAPGTALALDRPVQVFAAEHFSRIVQPWTCSAAPIHDPVTGESSRIIDLTGGYQIGSPHARALVQATVAAAESELRLLALADRQRRTPRPAHYFPKAFSRAFQQPDGGPRSG